MQFNALIPEFTVADIATSLDFYVGLLGFTVEYERPAEGFAFVSLGDAQVMLDQIGKGRTFITAPLDPPLGRGCNLQIMIDPGQSAAMLSALEKAGVPLFLAAEVKRYTVVGADHLQRQFAVTDPDGYLLRFACEAGNGETVR
jgi:catechol 2,3-dioxygenase-like lactoylglutathione lyase family enzyme